MFKSFLKGLLLMSCAALSVFGVNKNNNINIVYGGEKTEQSPPSLEKRLIARLIARLEQELDISFYASFLSRAKVLGGNTLLVDICGLIFSVPLDTSKQISVFCLPEGQQIKFGEREIKLMNDSGYMFKLDRSIKSTKNGGQDKVPVLETPGLSSKIQISMNTHCEWVTYIGNDDTGSKLCPILCKIQEMKKTMDLKGAEGEMDLEKIKTEIEMNSGESEQSSLASFFKQLLATPTKTRTSLSSPPSEPLPVDSVSPPDPTFPVSPPPQPLPASSSPQQPLGKPLATTTSSSPQQAPGKPLATVAPSRPSPAPLPAPLSEDEAKAIVAQVEAGDEEANAQMYACCLLEYDGKHAKAAETMKEKNSAALADAIQKYYNNPMVKVLARVYLEEPRLIRECQKQRQRAMTTKNFPNAASLVQSMQNLENLINMYAVANAIARNVIATMFLVYYITAMTEFQRRMAYQGALQIQTASDYEPQFAIESVIKLHAAQKGPGILDKIKQAHPDTCVSNLLALEVT